MSTSFENRSPVRSGVRIQDAFWSPKLSTFRHVSLPDTLDKLEGDGALSNYAKVIEGQGEHQGCPWHDGLLLETVRGAADHLRFAPDPQLEARLAGYAELIEQAQRKAGGGYLSTYTLLDRPHQRYGLNGGSIQWQHDLYNCGCLLEAGVHVYQATGQTRLLACALRCANELCETLGPVPKMEIVPGHSLPEYALLELYHLCLAEPQIADKTGVETRPTDYLALMDFWIRGRGHHENRPNLPRYMGEYAQDHAPIHQQYQAVGHAVRATLYYAGVTRLAMAVGDEALLADSRRLFDNVTGGKLHINGGIGATHFEEKFGADYDLPNTAYLETCATVGLLFWAQALYEATGDVRCAHLMERALYNLMLSSVTLQGDSYFYRNPLESDGSDHHWAWHGCPCCPPMIQKLFAMFPDYVYATGGDTCYVNLYVNGEAEIALPGGILRLAQENQDFPWSGEVALTLREVPAGARLALRLPEWAEDYALAVDGENQNIQPREGYLVLEGLQAGQRVTLSLPMPVRRVQAHPYVREDRGLVALQRGPLVYCLEGVDNRGRVDIELPEHPVIQAEWRPELLGGVMVLNGCDAAGKPFTAVPLYAWDNRLAGPMRVWLRQKNKPDTWDTVGWEGLLYKTYTEKG